MNARPAVNLVQLFTAHGALYVDTAQLARRRMHLTIYTARGNLLKIVGKTQKIREQAAYGVHFENLFASQELADAASDAIYRQIFGEHARPVKELRDQGLITSRPGA